MKSGWLGMTNLERFIVGLFYTGVITFGSIAIFYIIYVVLFFFGAWVILGIPLLLVFWLVGWILDVVFGVRI